MNQRNYSVRELLLSVVVVSVLLGWWLDHGRLRREVSIVRLTQGPFEDRRTEIQKMLRDYHGKDEVPLVIYVLSDPDAQIAADADQVLRKVSGNLQGFGSNLDSPELRLRVMRGWIDWYLSATNPFE